MIIYPTLWEEGYKITKCYRFLDLEPTRKLWWTNHLFDVGNLDLAREAWLNLKMQEKCQDPVSTPQTSKTLKNNPLDSVLVLREERVQLMRNQLSFLDLVIIG
jgi:hypothetical protein